jgi:hypothetical protein
VLELKVRDGEHEVVLQFEHSLRSLSKWEQKYKKPWSATPMKTSHEMLDYFQFMLLNGEDPSLIYRLRPEQLDEIANYISDPMTASSVPQDPNARPNNEIITAELVYCWMTQLRIDWQAQDWHFNTLMMLIAVVSYKQQPEKKQRRGDWLKKWNQQNAEIKDKYGTTG